jgi:hypothetical protein
MQEKHILCICNGGYRSGGLSKFLTKEFGISSSYAGIMAPGPDSPGIVIHGLGRVPWENYLFQEKLEKSTHIIALSLWHIDKAFERLSKVVRNKQEFIMNNTAMTIGSAIRYEEENPGKMDEFADIKKLTKQFKKTYSELSV